MNTESTAILVLILYLIVKDLLVPLVRSVLRRKNGITATDHDNPGLRWEFEAQLRLCTQWQVRVDRELEALKKILEDLRLEVAQLKVVAEKRLR